MEGGGEGRGRAMCLCGDAILLKRAPDPLCVDGDVKAYTRASHATTCVNSLSIWPFITRVPHRRQQPPHHQCMTHGKVQAWSSRHSSRDVVSFSSRLKVLVSVSVLIFDVLASWSGPSGLVLVSNSVLRVNFSMHCCSIIRKYIGPTINTPRTKETYSAWAQSATCM